MKIEALISILCLFIAGVDRTAAEGRPSMASLRSAVSRAAESMTQCSQEHTLYLHRDGDASKSKYGMHVGYHDNKKHVTSLTHFVPDPLRGVSPFQSRDPIFNSLFTFEHIRLHQFEHARTASIRGIRRNELHWLDPKEYFSACGFIQPEMHWVKEQFAKPSQERDLHRRVLLITAYDYALPYALNDDRWVWQEQVDIAGQECWLAERETEFFVDRIWVQCGEMFAIVRREVAGDRGELRLDYSEHIAGGNDYGWPKFVTFSLNGKPRRSFELTRLDFDRPDPSRFVPILAPGTRIFIHGESTAYVVPGGSDMVDFVVETSDAFRQFNESDTHWRDTVRLRDVLGPLGMTLVLLFLLQQQLGAWRWPARGRTPGSS